MTRAYTPARLPWRYTEIRGQVLIGQVFSGCSQCVFLNAAPLLSGLWFGENERVLATTIAMEANTLGQPSHV